MDTKLHDAFAAWLEADREVSAALGELGAAQKKLEAARGFQKNACRLLLDATERDYDLAQGPVFSAQGRLLRLRYEAGTVRVEEIKPELVPWPQGTMCPFCGKNTAPLAWHERGDCDAPGPVS